MQAVVTQATNQPERVENLPVFVRINAKPIQVTIDLLRHVDWHTERVVRICRTKQAGRGIGPRKLIASPHDQCLASRLEYLLKLRRIRLEVTFIAKRSAIER